MTDVMMLLTFSQRPKGLVFWVIQCRRPSQIPACW